MKIGRILNGALWAVIIACIIGAIVIYGGFIYSAIFAYPSPDYRVDTYAELQEKIGAAEEKYLMPDAQTIQEKGFGANYTVWLKDRFHDDPSGYYIGIYASEDYKSSVTVDCRLIEVMYKGIDRKPTVEPTEEYKGVGLQVEEGSAKFIYNGCYYNVNAESSDHALEIAKSMIDKI